MSIAIRGLIDNDKLSTEEKVQGIGQKLLDGITFGMGDEISAVGRAAVDSLQTGSGFSDNYEMYVAESRELEEQFAEEMPVTSAVTEVAASLVPALKLSMAVGNAATRLGNIARQGAVGAGEMLAREVGEGEGMGRVTDIDPLSVSIGAGLGGLGGSLMRGSKSIQELADAKARAMKDGIVTPEGLAGQSRAGAALASVRDDVYTVAKDQVGEIPARKMVTADAMSTRWKQSLHNPGRLPLKELDKLTKTLNNNPTVSKILADAGATKIDPETGKRVAVFSPAGRRRRVDFAVTRLSRVDQEAANTLRKIDRTIQSVQAELKKVYPEAAEMFEDGYFPLYAKADKTFKGFKRDYTGAKVDASTQARETGFITAQQARDIFDNPVHNFMTFFEDTLDAIALSRAYNVQSGTAKLSSIRSYTDDVIKAIEEVEAKEIGKEAANRLGEFLRLYAIDGRSGMGPLATVLRTASHAALLGTPENAMLQAGDLGQAAYATSFTAAIKSLPKALKSMILTDGDMIVTNRGMEDTLRMADLGLTRQHLTEMINENKAWLPKNVSKLADGLMQISGVRKANRLGVETNLNAQVAQMRNLATKGIKELGESVYAEGLDAAGLRKLYQGIKSGNVRNPAVMEAAFFRLGRFQPVSRTAMPTAYLNMKNGRLLWSMRLYMTKMASTFHRDVIRKTLDAEKAGLNTDAGRKLMREALINTGRYSSYILALNAIVDPGRKELARGIESERGFPEEMARQATSFATGGVIDPALLSYGMSLDSGLVPPAVAAGLAPVELILNYIQEGEVTPSDMKRAAAYIPGVRQLIWMDDVANPEGE